MKKRIFNSVGSNYTYGFALRTLFATGGAHAQEKLTGRLEQMYGGKALIFYKGRQAIEYALRHANLPKGSKVVIPSYTCVVLPMAIEYAGCTAVYADISAGSLDYSALELARRYDSSVKAIIVQNTLGFPADIAALEAYCKEHSIVLIEDLAHSVGGTYRDGRRAGEVGDYVILSFSQDKMLDSVSGGALIIRTKKEGPLPTEWSEPSRFERTRDRWYPMLSWKIRALYPIGIGRALHTLFRNLKFLPKPVISLDERPPLKLPGWYASLALYRFKGLESDIVRRRSLARKYLAAFPEILHPAVTEESIALSTCLRIPLMTEGRNGLVSYLEKKGIYLSDIWYDVPVSPKRFWYKFEETHYGPVAVETARTMFNLPTHMTLRDTDADRIIEAVRSWNRSLSKK